MKCNQHGDKDVQAICLSKGCEAVNRYLCLTCILDSHKLHDCIELDQYESLKQQVIQGLQAQRMVILDKVKSFRADLNKHLDEMAELVDSLMVDTSVEVILNNIQCDSKKQYTAVDNVHFQKQEFLSVIISEHMNCLNLMKISLIEKDEYSEISRLVNFQKMNLLRQESEIENSQVNFIQSMKDFHGRDIQQINHSISVLKSQVEELQKLQDIPTSKILFEIKSDYVRKSAIHVGSITAFAICSNEDIICGDIDGQISRWRNETMVDCHKYHTQQVNYIDTFELKRASCSDEGKIVILNNDTITSIIAHSDKITQVVFAFDAQSIYSISLDRTIIKWSLEGELIQVFQFDHAPLRLFKSSSEIMAFLDSRDYLNLFIDSQEIVLQQSFPKLSDATRDLKYICTVQGNKVILNNLHNQNDKKIQLFNEISSVMFNKSGSMIVVIDKADTVLVINLEQNSIIGRVYCHGVRQVQFSADETKIYILNNNFIEIKEIN